MKKMLFVVVAVATLGTLSAPVVAQPPNMPPADPADTPSSDGDEIQAEHDGPVASDDSAPAGDQSPEGVSLAGVDAWYGTRGDYAHWSLGDVSAHGWWVNHSLPSGTKANVDVKLQVNLSFLGWGFGWTDATGWFSSDIRAYNESRQRVTARFTCRGSAIFQWRSVVDVDILGWSDPANKLYTEARDVKCSPW